VNDSEQLLSYFSKTEMVSLPALRLALRACLVSEFTLGQTVKEKNRIFCLITCGIFWPDAMLKDIWAEIHRRSVGDPIPTKSDLPTLLNLCAHGHSAAQNVCRDQAIRHWFQRPEVMRRIFEVSLAALDLDELATRGQPENLEFARTLYSLEPAEFRILEVAALSSTRLDFNFFLTHFPISSAQVTWDVLAAMTCTTVSELQLALAPGAKLIRSGLLQLDVLPDNQEELVRLGRVGNQLFRLKADSEEELRERMLAPLADALLTQGDFPQLQKEIEWTVRCLRKAHESSEAGVHILIHGPSGSGKTELAKVLIKGAGLKGFNVQHLARTGLSAIDPDERIARVYWAEALLKTHATSALVFERVEEVACEERQLLIEVLDRVKIPTIWICKTAESLGASVLNRFVYHIELKAPHTKARLQMVERLLEPVCTDAGLVNSIANGTSNSPAQISMAVKFAKLCIDGATESPEGPLHSALRAGNRAVGESHAPSYEENKDAGWDVNALCLESSAPLPKILLALQHAQGATLAFHGIPGTGKTSLARHISQTLNRPLLAKRVSELSSKWIGETEKLMASMFEEATDRNAVLLLDEGDSFLRDRKLAKSSWEVTQVNEMLQQMESYKGVFICATNLMDDIDAAALRRFTFKIRFLPLDFQKRTRMFARFALGDPLADVRIDIAQRLGKLDQLAPGDFATIRRQESVLNERFDVSTWIGELEREHAMREPHSKQRAGFL